MLPGGITLVVGAPEESLAEEDGGVPLSPDGSEVAAGLVETFDPTLFAEVESAELEDDVAGGLFIATKVPGDVELSDAVVVVEAGAGVLGVLVSAAGVETGGFATAAGVALLAASVDVGAGVVAGGVAVLAAGAGVLGMLEVSVVAAGVLAAAVLELSVAGVSVDEGAGAALVDESADAAPELEAGALSTFPLA